MRLFISHGAAFFFLAVTLSGCGAYDVFTDPEKSQQGAEKIDIVALIAPGLKVRFADEKNHEADLRAAFNSFYSEKEETDLRLRRNRVQDTVIAVSNLSCAEYKLDVRQFDKNANFSLGLIATLTSGLGAIFENESTVRSLSGVSTIASGVRSQFNDVYIKESTKQLFTLAFEERRRKQLQRIRNSQSREINDYTLESAIADAIQYHDACSIVAGLEELSSNYPPSFPPSGGSENVPESPQNDKKPTAKQGADPNNQ